MKLIKVELPETNQEFLEHWVKMYKKHQAEIKAQEKEWGQAHSSLFKNKDRAEQMVGRYYLRIRLAEESKGK